MRNKLRPVLSFLALALFLLIALATNLNLFLETSSNVTVAIKNCANITPVSGTLQITALALDSLGMPKRGVTARVLITHQIVRQDTCHFDVVLNINPHFETDANGRFTYTGPDWIHANSNDLWRVEIFWGFYPGGAPHQPTRELQVQYNTSNFSFVTKQIPRL